MRSNFLIKIYKTFFVVIAIYSLSSCASYNVKSQRFQKEIQLGNNKLALELIDSNKFLKKKRNKLLYYLEKGKISHLNHDYKLSNELLNKADLFIEDNKKYLGGKLLGTLLNPEAETYTGEDFEKVAIHYYKALNYIFLNKFDEALVEAKRIDLQLQKINDSYPSDKKNRYSSDGFSLNLQGMIYEALGDVNNAFISYRNAVDLYLKNGGSFFGTQIPEQLKSDLLRTANYLGFTNEFIRYKKLLNIDSFDSKSSDGGEVIVFWENGLVPYKDQTFFNFTVLPGNKAGYFTIHNEELGLDLNLPIGTGGDDKNDFSDIDIFNVAFAKYVDRMPVYTDAFVMKDSTVVMRFQKAQNYSDIAFKTLKDRTFREIGKAAIRLATKKISEYTLRNQNNDLGAILGIFNALTERADTRNWQTLPRSINYLRIPLKKGDNSIEIELKGSGESKKTITVVGNGKLQFRKISTPQTVYR